jgi:hypothetical protein
LYHFAGQKISPGMWTPCEKLDCQIDRSTTTLLVCRLPLSLLPCASCQTHAEETENRTARVCLWPILLQKSEDEG